ncbi:hypothetical protein ACWZJV_13495 [Nocardioides sp. WG-D5]
MTAQPLRIADLRAALERTLDAVEAQHGPEVTFDVDHYWNVPITAAFNLDQEPDLDMGQLSDDAETISTTARGSDPVSIWHECDHLAGVLRALGHLDLP